MFKLLEERKDISDSPNARALQIKQAEITFDNVSFAYDKTVPILRNVSFTVRPGMKVAIVGQSGAGKSTIARLLYRFYDVTSGRILVDGQDIREVTDTHMQRYGSDRFATGLRNRCWQVAHLRSIVIDRR